MIAWFPTAAPAWPAFPGAEGFGTETPGGRGGRVITVTSLEDSGPGTLREAVTAKGPRTVVFGVGGEIRLKHHLRVTEPFITIAGQTAPGSGILLRDAGLYIATHDVVVRFIRCRNGPSLAEEFDTQDGMQISGDDTYNVVVDHCSISWSIDEVVGVRVPGHDITLSWNMVAEALRQPFTKEQIGKDRSHSMALILSGGPTRCTVHHNLLAHCNSRNPRIQGGRHALVNNVVYDWGWLTGTFSRKPEVNFIGNYYKPGPSSKPLKAITEKADEMGRIYVKGNRSPDRPNDSVPEWDPIVNAPAEAHQALEPFEVVPIKTSTAEEAYETVLREAGATLPQRDAVDRRVVRDVRLSMGGKIDRPDEVGGYPVVEAGQAPVDSDGDGMPDDWERAQGFDPHNPEDGKADADGDGYTNLEQYLEYLVAQHRTPRPVTWAMSIDRPVDRPFAVQAGEVKLSVVGVGSDPHTFYSHAYFSGELTLDVTCQQRSLASATVKPARFVDHLVEDEKHLSLRVCEEGPRVIETGPRGDSPRLLLFAEEMPEHPPGLDDANVIDARRFGVLGRRVNCTGQLQAALEACAKLPGGGVVFVADGEHEVDTLRIPSHATLYLARSAVLYAGRRSDGGPMVLFDGVQDSAVAGPGVIDGRGSDGATGAPAVEARNAKSIRISDLVVRDPSGLGIYLVGSEDVAIHRAKVVATGLPPGVGGLRIEGCRQVTVDRCFVSGCGAGITIDSTGQGGAREASGISVRQTVIMAGRTAVEVGPAVEAAIRDVLLQDIDVIAGASGLSVVQHGAAGIENVVFRDVTIELHSSPDDPRAGWPLQVVNKSAGPLRNVLFDRVTSNAFRSSLIQGESSSWVEDIKLWGVRVQAEGASAAASQPAPLLNLSRVRDGQIRFLHVTWPGGKEKSWSKVVATDQVENLKAPAEEILEK